MRKHIRWFSLFLVLILLAGCGKMGAGNMTAPDKAETSGLENDETGAVMGGEEAGQTIENNEPTNEPESGETTKATENGESETKAPTDETPASTENGGATEDQPEAITEINVQYIRTGVRNYDGPIRTPIWVISSAAELEAYYEENKDIYYLGRNEKVYSDTTIGFLDACDRYDEEFWAEHDLIIMVKGEGSGSIRHDVRMIVPGEEGSDTDWIIKIRHILPGIYTCDIATWHFLIEVPKGSIGAEETIRTEYVTDDSYERISEPEVQYIRTNRDDCLGGDDEQVIFMENQEALKVYCDQYDQVSAGFQDACSRFDGEFWEDNDLILVVLYQGSGSDRHEAVDVFRNELYSEEDWIVRIKCLMPGKNMTSTADVAVWHILIEVPEGQISDEDDLRLELVHEYVENKTLYDVQYIRTDKGETDADYPITAVIRSQAELEAYVEANKDVYELVWKDSYKGDSTIGLLNAAERYTTAFWEHCDLVIVVLEEDNKWIRHEVTNIASEELEGGLTEITIKRETLHETEEYANWHILVGVPKGSVTEEMLLIRLYSVDG